jgi:chain length determinant protein tyrosine kinase EpsG
MKPRLDEVGGAATLPRTPVSDRTIGGILLDAGKITTVDAERAMRLQKDEGLRFGDACVKLGLVTPLDIAHALSSQFDYPYLRPGQSSLSHELVAAYKPFSRQVEDLRALRTQLLLRWFTPDSKVLTIASPAAREGRSHLVANLAVVFSQLGENTLLIDADLRHPRQHSIFDLQNRSGLSAALMGRAGPESVERIEHFPSLSVLPSGAVPPNSLELLSRPEFPALIEQLTRRFDVILIDTPAAVLAADAQTIAVRAGGALLLAREGHTRIKDLRALAAAIGSGGGVVVGSVLNHS